MEKEYRIYFGKKFYKQKHGYWVSTTRPIPWAHRWVWINEKGPIPEGMDVHHIDGDKSNNSIENLEMLSRSEHLKKHWKEGSFDREQRRAQLELVRPKIIKWLKSPEGRKHQSEGSIEGWKKRRQSEMHCQNCCKKFGTRQPWAKFCSEACEKKWNRSTGKYDVEANCPVCAKVFLKDKYTKQKYCSISCGAKISAPIRERNRKLKNQITQVVE